MSSRFTKRLEARKRAYEERKQIRIAALEAKRARYEEGRKALAELSIGISSIKRGPTARKKPVARPERGARVETITPDLAPSREPLVDVFDDGKHLRVGVQLSGIPWSEDVIGELEKVSFKHGVLELKLKKREREELTKAERGALEAAEEGKVTTRVKEKLMMVLKKRREANPHR